MLGNKTIVAFDLYGTLLSTESIAEELAKLFDEDKAASVATLWRRYQLEYTWRINSMGIYRSFSDITRGALQHAVAESGLSLAPGDADQLMTAYDSLHVFPEIPSALRAVADNQSIEAYIFTNGTDDMAKASVEKSPDLGPHAGVFSGLITVDGLKVFKPDRRVYDDLSSKVGKDGRVREIWVVTANPFDAIGAKAAGLESAWVDRAGKGWIDRLGDVIGGMQPTVVASGVDQAVSEIVKRSS